MVESKTLAAYAAALLVVVIIALVVYFTLKHLSKKKEESPDSPTPAKPSSSEPAAAVEPSPEPEPESIENQVIYKSIKFQENSGLCLDVPDYSTDEVFPLHAWSCHGQDNQLWKIEDDKIINKNSGLCLDVEAKKAENGANVGQYKCKSEDNENQKWTIKEDGTIRPHHAPGKCLEVRDRIESGQPAAIWDCHGGPNQKWFLE